MCAEEIRRKPAQGFVKTTGSSPRPALTGEQKAQLIRKANDLFNQGQYDLAERIYIATGYSDGMVRIGDVHFKRQRYREAMRLYQLAPDAGRVHKLAKRMALVVRQWLIEDQQTDAAIQRIAGLPTKDKV
jgi:hypothetical protein